MPLICKSLLAKVFPPSFANLFVDQSTSQRKNSLRASTSTPDLYLATSRRDLCPSHISRDDLDNGSNSGQSKAARYVNRHVVTFTTDEKTNQNRASVVKSAKSKYFLVLILNASLTRTQQVQA